MEGTGHREHEMPRRADIGAAMDWWRLAGVDLEFSENPVAWLAPPEAPPAKAPQGAARGSSAPPPEPVPPRAQLGLGGDPAAWPRDLAAWQQWWLNEPSLDGGTVRGRIAPRGPAGADLMVVVGHPEAVDGEELLSGPEGRVLFAMLGALGFAPDAVYLASALPRHTPVADWDALAQGGLGAILRHHVGLVQPRRLLALGSGIPSLLGNDPAQTAQNSSQFYHEGLTIPLLGARELRSLLAKPSWKAGLWRRLLDWTGTGTA